MRASLLIGVFAALLALGCKKDGTSKDDDLKKTLGVGLVVDVGGRGDQSFNDSALRGLELWSAGLHFTGSGYAKASPDQVSASIAPELKERVAGPLSVRPVILSSKATEDYEPNLQLLVDQGASLIVATGFLLENATESVAKRNPSARFLLIDSPLLDQSGKPYTLPNVRSLTFKEEEGSFLVGALAGLVTQTGKVGFVGGVEIPLIRRFEVGFRAGVQTSNPKAGDQILSTYTGSFDNVANGKQVAEDLIAKGADVIFHAAGSDGVGVIQAVKEAHAAGKQVFAIGVDSDQSHLAPEAVLTSMVKRVDLAVYESIRALTSGRFEPGVHALGLKEGGVGYAPVKISFPKKDEALAKLEALRRRVVSGEIKVPAAPQELTAFKAAL